MERIQSKGILVFGREEFFDVINYTFIRAWSVRNMVDREIKTLKQEGEQFYASHTPPFSARSNNTV